MPKKEDSTEDKVAYEPPLRRSCGTMQVHERLMRTVPGYRETRDASENHAWRAAFGGMMGRTGCTKIPVVVHVVYKTAAQNISDAQIKSQIDVLNADFRKKEPRREYGACTVSVACRRRADSIRTGDNRPGRQTDDRSDAQTNNERFVL